MFQACRCRASNAPRSTGPDANPGWPWARARNSDSCHSGLGAFSPLEAQGDAGGVDAKRYPQERRHSPAGEPCARVAELRFKGDEVTAELCGRPGAELPKNASAALHQSWHLHGEPMATAELVQQNLGAIGLAQIAPVRHFDEKPETVGKCRIERLRPEILFLVVMVAIGGRIHCRPAIPQLLEFHPLHAPLVDYREELVLKIRPRAVEFIDETSASQIAVGVVM